MKRITARQLSDTYRVIEADQADFEALFALYRSNQSYFDYFSLPLTREHLRKDMTILPDGCHREQKRFLVYCDQKRPVAILDLIEGYPDDKTCYIGLFMTATELHGRGVGSEIITALCGALNDCGYDAVRLAYGKRHLPAVRFWTKNGFVPMREANHEEYGELIVAQRNMKTGGSINVKN